MPDCFLTNNCLDYIGDTCKVESIIDAEVVAPVVFIKITGGNGETITVGNTSTDESSGNKAVISSLHYGQTDGSGVTIEIVDEEGSSFTKFFDKIVTNLNDDLPQNQIEVKWGWVKASCNEGRSIGQGGSGNLLSKTHYFFIMRISTKFENTMKYVLECVDMLTTSLDGGRSDYISGEKTPLKDAIKQMCERFHPSIKVKFKRRNESGEVEDDWEFEKKAENVWDAKKRNPIHAINDWIKNYCTENKKGVRAYWDDTAKEPTIILWEDANPTCDGRSSSNIKTIGPYLVNGGQHSNVIQFNPTYHWRFGPLGLTGGINNAGNSSQSLQQQDDDKCNILAKDKQGKPIAVGSATTNVVDENVINTYGSQAAQKVRENELKNSKAHFIVGPIVADLVIQGNPQLDDPIGLRFAFASVIVINPFHLNDFSCPEWVSTGGTGTLVSQVALSTSTCHSILSNKHWLITGIAHDIQAGSYTTTLKVSLAGSGMNFKLGTPIGG